VGGRNNLSHKASNDAPVINGLNWLHCAAVSARQFNTTMLTYRHANPTHYDLLTNVYQIPESKQTMHDNDTGTNEPDIQQQQQQQHQQQLVAEAKPII
jgi:hypothetical protein